MTKVLNFLDPLPIVSAVLMGVALWLIFIWVPTEINQGAVQRILYFHVPVAWGSMLGIFVVSGSSIMYLWNKNEKWDRLAVASAEVGVVFGGLMLLSGMIWARPVWSVQSVEINLRVCAGIRTRIPRGRQRRRRLPAEAILTCRTSCARSPCDWSIRQRPLSAA